MPFSAHSGSLTPVAKITKPFGETGEVAVRLFDNFPEYPNLKEPLFVILDELTVPLFISRFTPKGRNKALLLFDDIDSAYRAKELIGQELLLPDDDSEREDDQLWLDELTGFRFIDERSGRSGSITGFTDDPNNPLFIAELDGTELYIPAQDDLIREIDSDKQEITFILPDGLIHLYTE